MDNSPVLPALIIEYCDDIFSTRKAVKAENCRSGAIDHFFQLCLLNDLKSASIAINLLNILLVTVVLSLLIGDWL